LKIYVLLGSVVTQLKCGWKFPKHYIANCPRNAPMKEY